MNLGDRQGQLITALIALVGSTEAKARLDVIDDQVPLDAPDRGRRRLALLEATVDAVATGGPPASRSASPEVADGASQDEDDASAVRHSGAKGETHTPTPVKGSLRQEVDTAAAHARQLGYRAAWLRVWVTLLRFANADPHRWVRIGASRLEAAASVGTAARRSGTKRLLADRFIATMIPGEGRWVAGRRAVSEYKVPPPPPLA